MTKDMSSKKIIRIVRNSWNDIRFCNLIYIGRDLEYLNNNELVENL